MNFLRVFILLSVNFDSLSSVFNLAWCIHFVEELSHLDLFSLCFKFNKRVIPEYGKHQETLKKGHHDRKSPNDSPIVLDIERVKFLGWVVRDNYPEPEWQENSKRGQCISRYLERSFKFCRDHLISVASRIDT